MAFLQINPEYSDHMDLLGLSTLDDFLQLHGPICNGHPDRNVSRVSLAPNGTVYLKKEHRVRWADRLQNFADGFGFVSKSAREAKLLRTLRNCGVPCPDVIAYGEWKRQAFLLLDDIPDTIDLRCALNTIRDPEQRTQLLCCLGETLALIHQAGFTHPDLCYKHILVQKTGPCKIHVLDWQRSHHKRYVGWSARSRDLAFLNATLPADLLSQRERRGWLRAYCDACDYDAIDFDRFVGMVEKQTERLLQKRRVREMRENPVLTERQTLMPVDGGRAWVTSSFRDEWDSRVDLPRCEWNSGSERETRSGYFDLGRWMRGRENFNAVLQRFFDNRPWRWLWSCLRRRKMTSAGMAQAAVLFRLERYNIPGPRLLVVGEHALRPWRLESFVVTEIPSCTTPLATWLHGRHETSNQRKCVLQQSGAMLAALHNAGFVADGCPFHVTAGGDVVVGDASGVRRDKHVGRRRRNRMLCNFVSILALNAAERQNVMSGYLQPRSNSLAVRLAEKSVSV